MPTLATARGSAQLAVAAMLPVFFAVTSSAIAAPVDDAIDVIEQLQGALVEAAALEPDPGVAGRNEQLAPIVSATHDLETMGRLTVRRFWRDWSEDERAAFSDAFERLSIVTYASRFAGVGPETFAILGGTEDGAERVEVHSVVRRINGEAVPIDYLLQLQDGHWQIINVFADGASELSLMASEYYAILESDGFDALLAEIESRILASQER